MTLNDLEQRNSPFYVFHRIRLQRGLSAIAELLLKDIARMSSSHAIHGVP